MATHSSILAWNSMDSIVHGVTKSQRGLTDFRFSFSLTKKVYPFFFFFPNLGSDSTYMRRESNLRKNSCSSLPVEFHGCEQPQAPSLALLLCSQVLVVSTESIFHDMLKSVNYTFSLARSHSEYRIILERPIFFALLVLYFFLLPTITKQSAFYHLSIFFLVALH